MGKTSSLNVGVDFGVLENRISGSVEYYIAKTSDLLMNQSIPVITGYAQILNNVGKTENRGFEVSLSTVNVKTKDFTWQTDWTFSLNNEKIKELAGGATYDSTGPWMVGEPLNSFYDFQYDRIWQNTQEDNHLMDVYRSLGLTFLPGQYKIVDQPLVEVPQGTEGSKTVEIKDAAGIKQVKLFPIWIMDLVNLMIMIRKFIINLLNGQAVSIIHLPIRTGI